MIAIDNGPENRKPFVMDMFRNVFLASLRKNETSVKRLYTLSLKGVRHEEH